MKKNKILQRMITFIMVCAFVFTTIHPIDVSAASTTQKTVTVKFTKTKATGFKTISSVSSSSKYLMVFGTKKTGNVISYSSNGTTFKDVNLDTSIKKKYKSVSISSIQLNTYLYYINSTKKYSVMGSITAKDKTVYHFLVSISSDMKTVTVLKLDTAITKLYSKAASVELEKYFDYDYDSGVILVNGTYVDASGETIPIYLIIKKGSTVTAYKTPNKYCGSVDFVGKYLVCYNYSLNTTSEWTQSTVGYFYYSKNYKTWTKAKTPEVKTANYWSRSYYDWESFCATPETDSDTNTVYYTSNMKTYKTLSKDFVVTADSRYMDFDTINNKTYAVERGSGDKNQLVISVKSGSKWKQLLNYTAKSSDFTYSNESWIGDGLLLLKDGSTKKLFRYGVGKKYTTKLDSEKLDLYGSDSSICYGVYNNKYLIASKNELVKYYLFKTPVKVNGMSEISTSSIKDRFYVYSDTAVYYVSKSTITSAVK